MIVGVIGVESGLLLREAGEKSVSVLRGARWLIIERIKSTLLESDVELVEAW